MKEEKSGKLGTIIYYDENRFFTIGSFESEDEMFYALGTLPHPKKGCRYRLIGEWRQHPRYGEQFSFSSFEELPPTSSEGMEAFLASGIIKGVGPATAAAIVARFGDESLEIMKNEPERLMEVSGIGKTRAESIAASYAEHTEYAASVMELTGYGISSATAIKLYGAYAAEALSVLKENPYRLIDEIYGIGFKKADEIARKMGFAEDSPFRIKSAILYYMNSMAGSGNSYMQKDRLLLEVASSLEQSRDAVEDALFDLSMDGEVFCEVLAGEEIVMLSVYYRAEQRCAGKLKELCESSLAHINADAETLIKASEKQSGISLSERQKDAVLSSLNNGVSVITGGPGTGKTTILRTILGIFRAADLKTALAAPTGRAAKRMSQATDYEASTIHRLLEYYFSTDSNSMRFAKTAEDPLDYDCIIIDEMSMVDVLLMDGLLAAIKPGTRLILVGDADQLPPVGAGRVLSDILSAGTIHAVRLKDIFRQAGTSMIVVNAHLINSGEYPSCNTKDGDFFMVERQSEADIATAIKALCEDRLPRYFDCDPFSDIQVLTPTRKGPIGSVELNKMLQAALNPPAPNKKEKSFLGRIYREGDRVMQTKNNYMMSWRDVNSLAEGSGIFNGELGIIREVDNEYGRISVLFDGEKLAVYDYAAIEELETAFAMTVHKSQGSEFPIAVIPIGRFPPMLANRNLLYTAITRATTAVVLVGRPRMLCAMVDNDSTDRRNSGLAARLEALWGIMS